MQSYFRRYLTFEAIGFAAVCLSLFTGFTSIGFFSYGKWICLGFVLLLLARSSNS